ncbi:MAG TPA: hypothetical protein ENJ82_04445, partial [Bacteroidetes bacterium]|nr:hypothetical protein [Bacteroidota bacterium]
MLKQHVHNLFRYAGLLGFFTLMALSGYAQPGKNPENRLEILKTDLFEFASFGEDSIRIRKLIGNVHLRQDTTDMYCDSAYQYIDSNFVVAYSNVHIVMAGGKRTIDADRLTYDGESKILDMFDNIV